MVYIIVPKICSVWRIGEKFQRYYPAGHHDIKTTVNPSNTPDPSSLALFISSLYFSRVFEHPIELPRATSHILRRSPWPAQMTNHTHTCSTVNGTTSSLSLLSPNIVPLGPRVPICDRDGERERTLSALSPSALGLGMLKEMRHNKESRFETFFFLMLI